MWFLLCAPLASGTLGEILIWLVKAVFCLARLKLHELVKSEIDFFKVNCNFTERELQFFDLRASGKSLIAVSLEMNISERTANRLSARVDGKVKRQLGV